VHRNSNDTAADYIRSFQNGEEKGFNFFFIEYYAALCYFSFQVVKEKSIAEEIAGDALMKLWERHENFKKLTSIKSFLYTTVRNASLNWIRQKKRDSQRSMESVYLAEKTENDVMHKMVEAETYREIHMALKTLPPQCKKIFQMIFLEGKEYDQIARELNLSTKTVYSQKDRALSLIRQRISLGLWIGFFLHLLHW
jgi:RNA polymerase sigma-19 factor, ECF subfamily